MFEKTCTKCGGTKPVTGFYKNSKMKDGLYAECKICILRSSKDRYEANKEHKLKLGREWHMVNKERKSETSKVWYRANKEHRLEISRVWRETNKEHKKKHYQDNKQRIVQKVVAYKANRIKTDPVFAASVSARNAVLASLSRRDFAKRSKTSDLLGCDWATFEQHLSSKFADGMSWANRSEWHIDHVTPLATAQNIEDVERLCHYTNLQPLWAADNLRKGAKITT